MVVQGDKHGTMIVFVSLELKRTAKPQEMEKVCDVQWAWRSGAWLKPTTIALSVIDG